MYTLLQDVRHASRGLLQARAFTTMAVCTLALGIAAATTVFSLFDAVLLRPLPFEAPERLVSLHERRNGIPDHPLSAHEAIAWRDQNQVFTGLAMFMYSSATLTGINEPEIVEMLRVSANYFDVLGLRPRIGRSFAGGEDRAGSNAVVVLSERLWRQRFAAAESAIGGTLLLNNVTHTIIGVMPSSGDMDPDLWAPMDLPLEARRVGRHGFFAFARLKDGVTIGRAEEDLATISTRLAQQMPADNAGHSAEVAAMHDDIVGGVRRPILVAFGAVGFVLLIACANVAHLLLTRGVARSKELAVRAALGASRGRLIRYLLIESLILALAGAAAGVLLATWVIDVLPAMAPLDIPRLGDMAMNGRVLVASLAIAVATGVLCGMAPALRSSRPSLTAAMSDGARSGTAVPPRLAGLLALSEVALALVLLVGAALMLQSFFRLTRVNPGFDPQNVLTVPIALPTARFRSPQQQVTAFQDLSARLASIPHVTRVGGVNLLPLTVGDNRIAFDVEGEPAEPAGTERRASLRIVAGDYFQVMGISLRRGRTFAPSDARLALPLIRWAPQQPLPPRFGEPQPIPVAMVNETMARQFSGDPIGRRVRLILSPWIEIVGVVGDVRHGGLARPAVPEIYLSNLQEPQAGFTLLVKSANDALAVAPGVRGELRAFDRDLPLATLKPMEEVLRASVGRPRFDALLLAAFSGIALLLAMIGIYGVTSYAVGQRTREIGIRAALGASRRDVLRLVLRRAMVLTLVGVAAGLAGAFALTGVLSKLLFGIEPTDATTFAGVALALMTVSLVASYIPARRALGIDPLQALRME
jgi:putative ABC transport system permease protein